MIELRPPDAIAATPADAGEMEIGGSKLLRRRPPRLWVHALVNNPENSELHRANTAHNICAETDMSS
ncbi:MULTISPECIES: hypothetical protein [Sinorhizobium/Ensifer group]